MAFIIEFIPKQKNPDKECVVVRRSDGFPLAVCDDLALAMDFIRSMKEKGVKTPNNA